MIVIGTRKSTLNKKRSSRSAWVMMWLRRAGVLLLLLIFGVWSGAWFFLSDAHTKTMKWAEDRMLETTAGMGFTVENILVEGRVRSDPEVLKAIVNVQRGDPLFRLHPAATRQAIERLAWVKSVRVERRLPDTVYIGIEERQPLALWREEKDNAVQLLGEEKPLRLLDEEGKVIEADATKGFADLIVFQGQDAPQQASAFIDLLKAEPVLYERVKVATWIGQRRWDLTLKSGIVLKLPEKDIGFALRRVVDAQEKDKILERDIESVDVREGDRLVIRTRPGGLQDYKTGVKSGSEI